MNSPGSYRGTGNARADTPDALKERGNRGASRFTRILLKHISGTQSVRTVASSDRFKTTERTHLRTSLSYVHYKLSSKYHQKRDYAFKKDLQDAYFHVADPSRQQDVPTLCIREQSLSVPSTCLQSEHSPSGIYSFGAPHCGRLPPSSRISIIPYLDDWLVHHPDHQVLLCHQSQLLKSQDMVGFKLNTKKSELEIVQDI